MPASVNRDASARRPRSLLEPFSLAVRRVARCVASDPSLCLRLVGWRLVLPALKFIVPLPRLVRLMWARPSAVSLTAHEQEETQSDVLEVVRSGGRLLISRNCLERSLVLYRYLSSSGAEPHLVVGVNKERGVVVGHTWVELNGDPIDDLNCKNFNRVAEFGASGRLCAM